MSPTNTDILHLPTYCWFNSSDLSVTMKVTLKEWNAVATWHWDMPEDEVCGICRVQFDGTCPTCKFPGDDCALCELRRCASCSYFGLIWIYTNLHLPNTSDWQMRPLLSYGETIDAS